MALGNRRVEVKPSPGIEEMGFGNSGSTRFEAKVLSGFFMFFDFAG